ncbi:MAG: FAD-dependent oxidoreductase [Rhodothermaceae bacterium]|nr:MAG: FAD-dependent oxidoreductase [Rhodothermaceae bacterium]
MPDAPVHPAVAVIGAGLSGLTAASTLHRAGLPVRIFDKGRGPGGRMSRRRQDGFHFDHGAQYFTARDPAFREAVEAWRAEGIVAAWPLRLGVARHGHLTAKPSREARYVGVPGMNAVARHLARGLRVDYGVRIEAVEPFAGGWHLRAEDGTAYGRFDVVLISAPPPQAVPLLAAAPDLAAAAARLTMAPCWAVMVAFDAALPVPFDGLFVEESPLTWVARNSSKPGRPPGETWVLHAGPDWSATHLAADPAQVVAPVLDAFFAAVGMAPVPPVLAVAHRWRYALPVGKAEAPCLWDPAIGLGACGDAYRGGRVEGAYLSGRALARSVLSTFGISPPAPAA